MDGENLGSQGSLSGKQFLMLMGSARDEGFSLTHRGADPGGSTPP